MSSIIKISWILPISPTSASGNPRIYVNIKSLQLVEWRCITLLILVIEYDKGLRWWGIYCTDQIDFQREISISLGQTVVVKLIFEKSRRCINFMIKMFQRLLARGHIYFPALSEEYFAWKMSGHFFKKKNAFTFYGFQILPFKSAVSESTGWQHKINSNILTNFNRWLTQLR